MCCELFTVTVSPPSSTLLAEFFEKIDLKMSVGGGGGGEFVQTYIVYFELTLKISKLFPETSPLEPLFWTSLTPAHTGKPLWDH